jgi:hypothetical protein
MEEKVDRIAKQQARFERKLQKLTAFTVALETADANGFEPDADLAAPGTASASATAAVGATVGAAVSASVSAAAATATAAAAASLQSSTVPPSAAELRAKLFSRHERHADKWLRKEYQLRPDGLLDVELTETIQEVEDDFNLVLGESKASLKRSLVFVGGIIRGYLRRGRNRDFIRTMRRLEARSKQGNDEQLEEAGLQGLVAPMQAYIAPPRLTINVMRRTVNVWDTIAKLWQFRHEQSLLQRLATQLYDHAEHEGHKLDFYVPQLANILLQLPESAKQDATGSVLQRFFVHRAAQSVHFALRAFLVVRAALHDHATAHRADDESESELSELSDTDDADSSGPTKLRHCQWCQRCQALLVAIRIAVGASDALLHRDEDLQKQAEPPRKSPRAPAPGGVDGASPPGLNPIPKVMRDMRLKVKGSFHGEVDVNVGGAKHWHRHEADVTGNSFSISVDSGSTSQQQSLGKAQFRFATLGSSVAYFDRQLAFLERLVSVSRELQATKTAVRQQRAKRELMSGGSQSRSTRRVSDSLAVPASPAALLSTSPTKSAPAPPPSAAAAAELSDALAASLQKQLRALQALLGSEGGVSIPLDDGGRAELPARVVQLVAETATPIATANRMLFAVDYEQVDAPTMDDSYDDVQLKSSEHGFALERRRRSSAAESPTHESDLAPPPVTSTPTTTAAALPAVAVVIKQSAAAAAAAATADDLSASVAAAVDAAVDEAVDASAADQVLRAAFGEPWRQHVEALRSASKFAGERGWTCRRIIVKYGDALMQEQLAMQLLRHAAGIFEEFNLDLPLLTYDIVATTAASGIIECVPNAVSLDALRHAPDWTSLPDFFESAFGPRSSPRYAAAHSTFVRSNAAYSLVSFVLQIKDRHNANVLLTSSGHLCHIDFGFVLTHTVAFEKAPFKLTEEVVNVMALLPTGAVPAATDATGFALYCSLCVQGYLAIRRRADRILLLLEMSRGFGRCYPGLDSDKAVDEVRARLHLDWSERQCADFVLNLIADARDNWRTTVFDSYQQFVNDIQ